jgi:hypothetical protein
MADFHQLDLGQIYAQAESINAAKEASTYRKLQTAAAEENIANSRADRELQSKQFTEEQRVANAEWLATVSEQILADPDPQTALKAATPEFHRRGILPSGFDPTTDPEALNNLRSLGQQARMAVAKPAAPKSRLISGQDAQNAGLRAGTVLEQTADGGYEVLQQPPEAVKPTAAPAAPATFRALTPEELEQVGLPPGTSAQMDETTRKIDVISRRDNTSTLSQKDQTTAKMKLNTVNLARSQLADIQKAFDGIKGTLSAGPLGQGRAPRAAVLSTVQ